MLPSVASLSERLRAVAQASVDQFDHAGQALQAQARGSASKGSGSGAGRDGPASPSSFLMGSRAQSPAGGGERPLSPRQQEKRPAESGAAGGDSLQARLMNLAGGKARASPGKAPAAKVPTKVDPADIPLPPSPEVGAVPDPPVTGGDPLSDPLGSAEGKQVALPDGMAREMVALSESLTQDAESRRELLDTVDRANEILRRASPTLKGGIEGSDALEAWMRKMKETADKASAEVKKMAEQLALQDSRIEEIRDTHRLESASSSKLINELRDQLAKSETSLSSQAGQQIEVAQLRADLTKAQTQAKEEEEKRSKAISLLKTVRQKLVKLEKERDEGDKRKEEDKTERIKMVENLEKLRMEREKEVSSLRAGFEKEAASIKERYERDLAGKKGQWELDLITTKAGHAKEIAQKVSRISTLEASVKEMQTARQEQFQTMQAKQDEVDRYRTETEAAESSKKELAYQLKEAQDRIALLEEELGAAKRSQGGLGVLSSAPAAREADSDAITPADLSRLLAEAQAKSEAKLSELRHQINRLEKDRSEMEEESAKHLQDRTKELERLRTVIREKDEEYMEAVRGKREMDDQLARVESSKNELRVQIAELQHRVETLDAEKSKVADLEYSAADAKRLHAKELEAERERVEEAKNIAAQLRTTNKTLRDEMRKLQSSVQLLEKRRNPGVGYWSTADAQPSAGNKSPAPLNRASTDSPRPAANGPTLENSRNGSPAPKADEEEVNLEYLRNVILQFLEKEEMRPNLVKVLSVILHFTPQELRRLQAKI